MATTNLAAIPTVNSTLACTTSSANVLLPATGGSTLIVQNVGSVEAFIAQGTDNTVTATAGGSSTATSDGSFPIPAGITTEFSIPNGTVYIAGRTASGSTTLRLSRTEGQ